MADMAGVPTYWTEFGEGPRAALMIHCSLAHSGAWSAVARHLAGLLHMTAFDLPGHGRSGPWDESRDVQDQSTGMAAGFLTEPMDIIGHSFGATVALRLAVERPELVRSLVLIEPVFFAVAAADHPEIAAAYERDIAPFDAAFQRGDRRAATRAFIEIWGGGVSWDAIPEPQKDSMAATIHVVRAADAALFGDRAGMLASGALERIAAPALLIEGSTSPPVIAAINEGLAARLPMVERSVIVGAGHMAPITHAVQVSDEILRFLRRV